MKGKAKVIADLNDALSGELTAINQYFIHGRMCANWGYEKLAAKAREEAFGEMKHAEALIDRILFLDGVPNMQKYNKIVVGTTVREQLENDLRLEMDAVRQLNAAIKTAVEVGDNGSRDLFQHVLNDEEGHVDYLEAQLHLIDEIGLQNYLAQHIKP